MKQHSLINKLYLLVSVVIFVTACATTQETVTQDDDTQTGGSVEGDGTMIISEDDVGASTSTLSDEQMRTRGML